MEDKKTKWWRLGYFVSFGIFWPVVSIILVIIGLIASVSWSAKASADEAVIKVNNLSSQVDTINRGIDDLNKKFDLITEIKIRQ